jgi:hypothetical protein
VVNVKPNVAVRMGGQLHVYRNKMVQRGLDWVLDLIAGLEHPVPSHVAVGDGSQPVSLGDLALGNERARKLITSISRDEGAVVIEGFFSESEANFDWTEIGLFAGGSEEQDTGVLLARALVTEAKDVRRTATVTWEIGVANAV